MEMNLQEGRERKGGGYEISIGYINPGTWKSQSETVWGQSISIGVSLCGVQVQAESDVSWQLSETVWGQSIPIEVSLWVWHLLGWTRELCFSSLSAVSCRGQSQLLTLGLYFSLSLSLYVLKVWWQAYRVSMLWIWRNRGIIILHSLIIVVYVVIKIFLAIQAQSWKLSQPCWSALPWLLFLARLSTLFLILTDGLRPSLSQ